MRKETIYREYGGGVKLFRNNPYNRIKELYTEELRNSATNRNCPTTKRQIQKLYGNSHDNQYTCSCDITPKINGTINPYSQDDKHILKIGKRRRFAQTTDPLRRQ